MRGGERHRRGRFATCEVEDDGKRAGLFTEPDNSSASEAARKKGGHLFRRYSHRTRSCRSQRRDTDHVVWRGQANALSPSEPSPGRAPVPVDSQWRAPKPIISPKDLGSRAPVVEARVRTEIMATKTASPWPPELLAPPWPPDLPDPRSVLSVLPPRPRWYYYGTGRTFHEGGGGGVMSQLWSVLAPFPRVCSCFLIW